MGPSDWANIATDIEADFLVSGVNGYGEAPLGSVSSGIVLKARSAGGRRPARRPE